MDGAGDDASYAFQMIRFLALSTLLTDHKEHHSGHEQGQR